MISHINHTPSQGEAEATGHRHHICSFVPPHLLQAILKIDSTPEPARIAAEKTYHQICKLHQSRASGQRHPSRGGPGAAGRSIVPPHLFQAIGDSEATPEEKDVAKRNLAHVAALHETRTVAGRKAPAAKTKHLYRVIYDSKKSDDLPGTSLFEEGHVMAASDDASAKDVYTYFGNTYDFYYDVLGRNSIDDRGMKIIGSIHYDDEPGPPGMDNAFWNGSEMAFGDGDQTIFGSFTKNLDVIGHELTHGVTSHEADLAYEYQAGALNESLSDVFGSMIKQYFHPGGKQTAADADWLIGEGIFLPAVANAAALRSMKAPGTAYNNPSKIGTDPQPADMDGYQDMPNTDDGDSGGVHINSGIPNRAFYLAAVALGGYSWEKAGKIWYATLRDPALKGIESKTAFKAFADLTCQHAKTLFDDDAAAKVQEAWTVVKVYRSVQEL